MSRFRSVSTIAAHDHACLLYASDAERWDVAAAYVDAGLRAGERVVVVGGEEPAAAVVRALATAGAGRVRDADPAQLLAPDASDVFRPGRFDPAALTAGWEALAHDALAAGFRGLRVVADMDWARRAAVAREELFAYERSAAALFARLPVSAICLYDERTWGRDGLLAAASAHPAALCGGWHHHASDRAGDELTLTLCDDALAVAGTVDLRTVDRFADVLRIASAGKGRLVLDLSELVLLDVRGLRPLYAAARELAADGRALVLREPPPLLRRVLTLLADGPFAAPRIELEGVPA